jgi:hypothetical protein
MLSAPNGEALLIKNKYAAVILVGVRQLCLFLCAVELPRASIQKAECERLHNHVEQFLPADVG